MMRRGLLFSFLVSCLIYSASMSSADENKDTDKKDPPKVTATHKESKEKLGAGGIITGKLTRVEGAQKYLTVQVTQEVPATGGGGFNVGKRHVPGMQMKQVTQNLEIQAADDMKVRMLQPPVDYDDKGKLKKYSTKELKALKGDDAKLPGFAADFDSLKSDQMVKVYLAKSKSTPKSAARPKPKDGEAAASPDRPQAQLVVIIREPQK